VRVFIALVLFTDTAFFTRLLAGFQAISVAMIVYGIVRLLALTLRQRKRKNILACTGITLMALFIVGDILGRYGVPIAGWGVSAATGMALFVFCYAMVLSIERTEINARLEEARAALAAAEARYHDLAQTRAEGAPPAARIQDFDLTRRETEVTLLILDGKSREEVSALLCISMGTVNFHCTNIYRKTASGSIADLVRKLQPGAGE
jgi:DNA-binding CsgD family transcriptional regulator